MNSGKIFGYSGDIFGIRVYSRHRRLTVCYVVMLSTFADLGVHPGLHRLRRDRVFPTRAGAHDGGYPRQLGEVQ